MPRLTWSKETERRLFGLPKGFILKLNGQQVAEVNPCGWGWSNKKPRWYWRTYSGIEPYKNNQYHPNRSLATARSQCEAYVRKRIGLPKKER